MTAGPVAAPPPEPERDQRLKERLRAAESEVRALRAVIAVDQAQRGSWDRLEATLDAEAVRSTITRAVADAPIDTVPMPHLVVRGLLPAATYDALLEAIPPDALFPERDP